MFGVSFLSTAKRTRSTIQLSCCCGGPHLPRYDRIRNNRRGGQTCWCLDTDKTQRRTTKNAYTHAPAFHPGFLETTLLWDLPRDLDGRFFRSSSVKRLTSGCCLLGPPAGVVDATRSDTHRCSTPQPTAEMILSLEQRWPGLQASHEGRGYSVYVRAILRPHGG